MALPTFGSFCLFLHMCATQNEPLDAAGTTAAFETLAADINAQEAEQGRAAKSLDEIAMGFITVANEAMCRPIRALTQMKVCLNDAWLCLLHGKGW